MRIIGTDLWIACDINNRYSSAD